MVSLFDVTVFLLCIAVAGIHVLDCLPAICPHNPAGAVALFALSTAYFTAMILVYLQTALAPPVPVSPSALRLLSAMAFALLLLLAIMPLAPWLFSI